MPRLVFMHYHGIGHINPFFPLARILEENGYKIFFAGVEFFREHVESAGFEFYPLRSVPFGLGFETWLNTIEKKRYIYFATLLDRITDRVYQKREQDLTAMLSHLSPDTILMDGAQATDFIVLYPHLRATPVQCGIFHAMLPTHVLPGRPPVNSDAFPEDKPAVTRAIRRLKWYRLAKAWKQKIMFLLFDDDLIVRRRIRKNKIPMQYRSKDLSLFHFNMRNLPELIAAPREFDFPGFIVPSFRHYMGFINDKSITKRLHKEYDNRRAQILDSKRRNASRVIYCSFGTTVSNARATIVGFLQKLIAITTRKQYLLIISIGHADALLQVTDSDHLFIFHSVNQLDVLTYANVFVTHGGLSSIKEAIDAEVPMLMYPVHADYDPIGNAARVAYHGLGLRGDIKTDTVEKIEEKIKALLNDVHYLNNIRDMREKNSRYDSRTFIDLIDKLPSIL